MADIEAIRARCAQSVTEIVASPSEYFRVQQILRDRRDLLALVDELRAKHRADQLLRQGMTTLCNETERLLRLVVEDYNDNVGQVRKEVRDFLADMGSGNG